MKKAAAISTGLHAAVLLWALVSFSGTTFEVTPAESLPVDLVSENEFSQMTKGTKDAPKLETLKPRVDKIGDTKPADDPAPKITDKKEVKPTDQKAAEPQPLPKPDPIAEKLKKQDEQKDTKADPQPLPPKKPEKQQPKFDADKIAALLDKREPQRNAAAGEQLSKPSLGAASGESAKLSQSEIDALRGVNSDGVLAKPHSSSKAPIAAQSSAASLSAIDGLTRHATVCRPCTADSPPIGRPEPRRTPRGCPGACAVPSCSRRGRRCGCSRSPRRWAWSARGREARSSSPRRLDVREVRRRSALLRPVRQLRHGLPMGVRALEGNPRPDSRQEAPQRVPPLHPGALLRPDGDPRHGDSGHLPSGIRRVVQEIVSTPLLTFRNELCRGSPV